MTTYREAADAADRLVTQAQGLMEDGRYVPRFFDRLFALRTRLGEAAEAFAAAHGADRGEPPLFAVVRDRCAQALSIGRSLTPDEAALSTYAGAVGRAIDTLAGAAPPAVARMLRGSLRLDLSDGGTVGVPARAAVRPFRRPRAHPEPYYASLVKLFPVEAVTLYPLALGIAAGSVAIRLLLIAAIALFVVVLRWFATQEDGGGEADRPAIAVSVASFLLYAASLGGFGYLPGGPAQTRQLLAFLTIMWVALVPFVLRRARRPRP